MTKSKFFVTLGVLAIAGAMLLFLTPAKAMKSDKKAVAERVQIMVDEAAARAGYVGVRVNLGIQFRTPKQIYHTFYPDGDYEKAIANDEPGAVAYTYGTSSAQFMVLSENIDLGTADPILLHEAVHVLQYASGKTFGCVREMEAEAYRVHKEYADEKGLEGDDRHLPGPMLLMVLTLPCGLDF